MEGDNIMITYNLDKFTNGTIKLLFIFGYSGSGKSTLARSLANKYKCKIKVMERHSVENCYKELKNILINTSTRSDKNQYIIEGPMEHCRNSTGLIFRRFAIFYGIFLEILPIFDVRFVR